MMEKYDESIEINDNSNWPYIPDNPYSFNNWWFKSGKNNALLNLIKYQRPNIDKTYLYAKDPFESNYKLLINGREKFVIEKFKYSK